MTDSGRHEQADKLLGFLSATHASDHSVVVVDAAFRRDELIRPSMPDDQLAVRLPEPGQIGIGRADDCFVLLHRLVEQLFEACRGQRGEIPRRILQKKIPKTTRVRSGTVDRLAASR